MVRLWQVGTVGGRFSEFLKRKGCESMGLFSLSDVVVLAASKHDEYMASKIAAFVGAPYLDVDREYFYGGEGAYQPQVLGSVRNKLAVIVAAVVGEPMARQMELNLLISAVCDSTAEEVLVIMPYNSWVRSDKKDASGIPYGLRTIAKMMEAPAVVSMRRISVMLCDLHNDATAALFSSVDVITVRNILLRYAYEQGAEVVAAADTGGVKSAKKLAEVLGTPHGVADKTRKDGEVDVTGIWGADVRGKTVLVMDDEIGKGSSIRAAKEALRSAGAKELIAECSHPVFYTGVEENLWTSDDRLPIKVVATNTVPLNGIRQRLVDEGKLIIVDVSPLFGEALRRWVVGESLGIMHEYDPRSWGSLEGHFEPCGSSGLIRWVFR